MSSPPSEPDLECSHHVIDTFRAESGDVAMWACASCRVRFYPVCPTCVDVGHRNVVHQDADETLLEWEARQQADMDTGTVTYHSTTSGAHPAGPVAFPHGCAYCGGTHAAARTDRDPPPKRIQRKRTKGWRMPEGAVYVGRPSRWGNAHHVWKGRDRADAVRLFEAELRNWNHDTRMRWLAPLRGRDLACWCPPDQPCHADVLLELANA